MYFLTFCKRSQTDEAFPLRLQLNGLFVWAWGIFFLLKNILYELPVVSRGSMMVGMTIAGSLVRSISWPCYLHNCTHFLGRKQWVIFKFRFPWIDHEILPISFFNFLTLTTAVTQVAYLALVSASRRFLLLECIVITCIICDKNDYSVSSLSIFLVI